MSGVSGAWPDYRFFIPSLHRYACVHEQAVTTPATRASAAIHHFNLTGDQS